MEISTSAFPQTRIGRPVAAVHGIPLSIKFRFYSLGILELFLVRFLTWTPACLTLVLKQSISL